MRFELNAEEAMKVINDYSKQFSGVGEAVDDYIHGEVAEKIKSQIIPLIPVSNRNKTHARYAVKFGQENERLAVTIKAAGKWGYLVFPDQGVGNKNPEAQHFMFRGMENATQNICKDLENILANKFGG